MTRLQTLALFAASCCVVLGAGLTWRAYAPDGAQLKLSLFDSGKLADAPRVQDPQRQAKAAPPEQETPVLRPEFDVVRVEPSGESVIAGRGRPLAKIAIMAGGNVLAEIMADESGHFVATPTLPPGDVELSLRDSAASIESLQSVIVSVPHKPGDKTIVALAEPGKPTVLLTSPPAVKSEETLAFIAAEIDKSGFYAAGRAKPDAHLRIYADDHALADVVAGSDGRWSLLVAKGLSPGPHKLRADSFDAAGQVVARAEIPFEVPADLREAKAEALPQRVDETAAHESPAAKAASATVQRGDNLWRISRKLLGAGPRYTQIYEANTGQIRNPKLIYPGQVFIVPPAGR
ncbi:MAG: LysM peptidoglycan-binding domain-containing protein [Beijerinckiaceae bacterium]